MSLSKDPMILEMHLRNIKILSIGKKLVKSLNYKNWWKSERTAMRRANNDLKKIIVTYEEHLSSYDVCVLRKAKYILFKLEPSVDYASKHSTEEMSDYKKADLKKSLRLKADI